MNGDKPKLYYLGQQNIYLFVRSLQSRLNYSANYGGTAAALTPASLALLLPATNKNCPFSSFLSKCQMLE